MFIFYDILLILLNTETVKVKKMFFKLLFDKKINQAVAVEQSTQYV